MFTLRNIADISRRLILGLILLISALLSGNTSTARQTERPENDQQKIAKVGERDLTLADIDAVIKQRFPAFDFDSQSPETLQNARRAAAVNLVRRELAFQRLLDLGGDTLQAKIRRKLSLELETLRRAIPEANLTPEQESRISWEVAWSGYLNEYMTDQNIQKFFEANAWKYDDTSANVAQVFIKGEQAEQALKDLKDKIQSESISFAEAARENSQAPTAADGGQIGWIKYRGDLPVEVAALALQASEGEVVGPVKSNFGWHLVLVNEIKSGTTTFDQLKDLASVRRDAADYLFLRLVKAGSEKTSVQWIDPKFAPPQSEPISP